MSTASFWPQVFESFRKEDHKLLVVSTTTGLDVAVQEVCRIEEELVLIRGRISGTADAGRLFLLPYQQLSSVYVNRVVRMEEVELFSPSVSPERKMEVARVVAEIERKARDEARLAELAKSGGVDMDPTLKKLETLREAAGAEHILAHAASGAGGGSPLQLPAPQDASKPSIPNRFAKMQRPPVPTKKE